MKRTNLVLNEEYLEHATRLLGAKTYSEAVNRALQETIKLYHIRGLVDLMGQGLWQGDLAEGREDQAAKPAKSKRNSK
jgi:hypothetical protein